MEALPLEEQILSFIDKNGSIDSFEFSKTQKISHEKVKGTINSLSSKGYVTIANKTIDTLEFTKDGKDVLANGTPEFRIYKALTDEPIGNKALKVCT